MTKVQLEVGMTCEKCEAAVKEILGKVEGVSSIETSVEEKSVVVTIAEGSSLSAEDLGKKLKDWSESSGKYVKY